MCDFRQGQSGLRCKYTNKIENSYICEKIMTYPDFEKALSKPRIGRFLLAVNGDYNKAIQLYKLNIQLSQTLYGLLSIFEVTLRNNIDQHYRQHFNDNEWLKNQCGQSGMFSHCLVLK